MRKIKDLEIFKPIKDFFCIKTNEELIKNIIMMIILFCSCISIVIFSKSDCEITIEFFEKIVDIEINIISLLLSFSIAYLTMLITASGNNIERLKKYICNIKIDNEFITAFQILLIELTFSIYLEIFLLIILIINKFVFLYDEIFIKAMFFMAGVILLFDVVIILLKLIKNIYFSFWKT